ncbi:glycosyltransferase [Nostoc sp. CHAB 5824]|nr:glycosyltransferase [Nostoc sp. CHAB 5824]
MTNQRPIKVLMISNQAHALGGAHAAFRRTADLLRRNGVDVRQFSLDDVVSQNEISKRPGIGDIGSYLFNRSAAARIRSQLTEFAPDIAHIHLFVGGLSSSILLELARAGIPILHTAHDYRLICPANAMLDTKGRLCERCKSGVWNCVVHKCAYGELGKSLVVTGEALVRRALRVNNLIDRYIFVSKFSRDKYAEFDAQFAQKGIIVPNFLAAPSGAIRTAPDRSGFLYFGRLSHEKGLKNLLETFAQTELPLTIVGDGPLADYVVDFSRRSSNIKSLGPKSYPELGELISSSRFCIVPSVWYENNPLAVIEAFALGTPVLASDIGGLSEMVRPQKNGDLFEFNSPEDMLKSITKAASLSDGEWEILSDGAIDSFNSHYSEQAFLDKILSEYRSVLGQVPERCS